MTPEAHQLVDDWLWSGKLTRRGVTRVHRLAWTIADLAEVDQPGESPRSTSRSGCAPATRSWRPR